MWCGAALSGGLPPRHSVTGVRTEVLPCTPAVLGTKGSWPRAGAPRAPSAPYLSTAGKQHVALEPQPAGVGLCGAVGGQRFLNKYCKGEKSVGLRQKEKWRVGSMMFDS